MKVNIYEFCGLIGSGKTYFAKKMMNEIEQKDNTMILYQPFSLRLKDYLWQLGVTKNLPIDYDEMMSFRNWIRLFSMMKEDMDFMGIECKIPLWDLREKFENIFFNRYLSADDYNPSRLALQVLGTDIIRHYIHHNYWVLYVYSIIKNIMDNYNDVEKLFVFIDDYRFPNEDLSKMFSEDENVNVRRIKIKSNIEDNAKRLNISIDKYRRMLEHESEKYIFAGDLGYDEEIENNI